jgi:hypothetical protein
MEPLLSRVKALSADNQSETVIQDVRKDIVYTGIMDILE